MRQAGETARMSLPRRLWNLLTRMQVAVWLLLALAAACMLGGLYPQMPPGVRADPALRAEWLTHAADKLGSRAALYRSLSLFDVFHSVWFYVPLGLLTLNTLVCTLNRLNPTLRTFTRPHTLVSERLFERLPYRASFSAVSPEEGKRAAHRALRSSGFVVHFIDEQAGGPTHLTAERGRFGRLGSLLVHIGLLLLLVAVGVRGALAWRDEALSLPPGQAVTVGHSRTFALRNDGFELDVHPDDTPSNYRAYVSVLEGGHEIKQAVVRVNHPLKYHGVKFYLYSVGEMQSDTIGPTVTLMTVYDPSFPMILMAGVFIVLGLILAFHVPHNRVWVRVEPDGTVRLAGTTNKLEEGFARRFKRLEQALQRGDAP